MIQLDSNTVLQNGKYLISRALGQGGFGITYEAEQVALHRRVAIKEFFMKEYCDRDSTTSHVTLGTSEGSKELVEKFRTKFIREAQMIAGLDNPHIIKIHDIFEENGTAYYVMPFLDGGSLADKVKQNGPMQEREAIGYIKQVGDALDYLHKQNILHLDVKPSNVLLNAAGEAVLIDFGISKHYDEAGSQTSTTPVGISKGYAPMEQYQQGNMTKFSPATDIYSLGATLYFLLTGQTPPEAAEVNEDGIPETPHISTATNKAIEQAMSPKRKDRPQSILSFMAFLEPNLSGIVSTEFSTESKKNEEKDESTVLISPIDSGQKEGNSTQIETPKANSSSDTEKKKKPRAIYYLFGILALCGLLWLLLRPSNQLPETINVQEDMMEVQDSVELIHNEFTESMPTNESNRVLSYTSVETKPTFKGGSADTFLRYIQQHVEYPQSAIDKDIQGTVTVGFIVDIHGNVTNVRVVKGVSKELDAEALRVVKNAPAWTPAKQNGKSVPVTCSIPITFKLVDDVANSNIHNSRTASSERNESKAASNRDSVSDNTPPETISYAEVDVEPLFQGGDASSFSNWVSNHLSYPEEAKENGVSGRVMLQFTVSADGSVSDVTVLRGVDPVLDQEAVRVIRSSPKWTPGELNGKRVNVIYQFPVIFQLK